MRAARARPLPTPGSPLARVLLALSGSLLAHGVVLAAVFFAPAGSPPVPVPAVLVELVPEAGGSGGEDGGGPPAGGGEPPRARAVEPAPLPPVWDEDRKARAVEPAPPVPASATDPVGAPPARAARERPVRASAAVREPRRLAALPPVGPAASTDAPPAGSAEGNRGEPSAAAAAGRGGSSGGGSADGGPPGFAPGSAENPLPHYPTVARRRGIEGTVILDVLVNAAGLPERVAIARSSGSGLLDDAALEAVRRWRFRPARRAGEPVEGKVAVPITFRLVEAEQAALR